MGDDDDDGDGDGNGDGDDGDCNSDDDDGDDDNAGSSCARDMNNKIENTSKDALDETENIQVVHISNDLHDCIIPSFQGYLF